MIYPTLVFCFLVGFNLEINRVKARQKMMAYLWRNKTWLEGNNYLVQTDANILIPLVAATVPISFFVYLSSPLIHSFFGQNMRVWMLMLVGVILWSVVRLSLSSLWFASFKNPRITHVLNGQWAVSMQTAAILALPFLLFYNYNPMYLWALWTAGGCLLLGLAHYLVRCWIWVNIYHSVPRFYNIIYFCTLELLPWLIFVKLIWPTEA